MRRARSSGIRKGRIHYAVRHFVVVGYGWCGNGVARYLHAPGENVSVCGTGIGVSSSAIAMDALSQPSEWGTQRKNTRQSNATCDESVRPYDNGHEGCLSYRSISNLITNPFGRMINPPLFSIAVMENTIKINTSTITELWLKR